MIKAYIISHFRVFLLFVFFLFSSLFSNISAINHGDIITIYYNYEGITYYLALDQMVATNDQMFRVFEVPDAEADHIQIPSAAHWIVMKRSSTILGSIKYEQDIIANLVYDRLIDRDLKIGTYPSASGLDLLHHAFQFVKNELHTGYYWWEIYTGKYIANHGAIGFDIINKKFVSIADYKKPGTNIRIVNYDYVGHADPKVNSMNFHHNGGTMNALDLDGRQMTHSYSLPYYARPNDVILLKRAVRSIYRYPNGFHRWYNYDTDKWDDSFNDVVDNASGKTRLNLNGTVTRVFANGYGKYIPSNYEPKQVHYTMKDDKPVKIAVDVSSYADYHVVGSDFDEPTLSYRRIYDIRPASEIAAALEGAKFGPNDPLFPESNATDSPRPLEVTKIDAPANTPIYIGPHFSWTGQYTTNYFVNVNDSPEPVVAKWYVQRGGDKNPYEPLFAGNAVPEILDNQFISFTTPAVGATDVVELRHDIPGSKYFYVIARFVVTSVDPSFCGPKLSDSQTASVLDDNYFVAAERTFDYTTTYGKSYPRPLPWGETSYGFVYTSGTAGLNKTRVRGFTDCGEYALISDVSQFPGASWVSNGVTMSKSGKGYFMFCDLTEDPSLLCRLSLKGSHFYPGSLVKVSASVANICSSTGLFPNIYFYFTGENIKGETVFLKAFTTGDIKNDNTGKWQDVMFDVILPKDINPDGNFSLRIFNMSKYPSGETSGEKKGIYLGLDDIKIYIPKPTVYIYQAMGFETEFPLVVGRFDYTSRFTPEYGKYGIQKAFYSVEDKLTKKKLDLNYLNKVGEDNYGYIAVNPKLTLETIKTYDPKTVKVDEANAVYPYYASVMDFFKANHAKLTDGMAFYSSEMVGGVERPLIYLVHTSANIKPHNTYSLLNTINTDGADKEPDFTKSTFHHDLTILPSLQFVINSTPVSSHSLSMLDASKTYNVSVRSFGVENYKTVASDETRCDWFLAKGKIENVDTMALDNSVVRYRQRPNVNQIITDNHKLDQLRYEDIDGEKVYDPLYTYEDSIRMDKAIKSGNLFLNYDTLPVNVTPDAAVYTVYARPFANDNNNIIVPRKLLRIELSAGIPISLGKTAYNDLPQSLKGAPCVYRVSESEVGTKELIMNVNNVIGGAKLISKKFVIVDTDNPHSQLIGSVGYRLKKGTNLNNIKVGVPLTFVPVGGKVEGGYYYTFAAITDPASPFANSCQFTVYVVPQYMMWSPSSDAAVASDWNNDANWVNAAGFGRGFIPTASTNIIVTPLSKTSPAPSLIADAEAKNKVNSDPILMHQYGVDDVNVCNEIQFESGAVLGNQHLLQYKKAWVDFRVPNSVDCVWKLASTPLEGVVSGDFYIPKEGDIMPFDFKPAAPVDTRATNRIYQSLYQSSADIVTAVSGSNSTGVSKSNIKDTQWSESSNFLGRVYTPGKGFALHAHASQGFVRLPKDATTYYYWDVNTDTELGDGWESVVPPVTNIDRINAHKLVYDSSSKVTEFSVTLSTDVDSDIFLVGNPFMSNLNVKAFYDANKDVIDNAFYFNDNVANSSLFVTADNVVIAPTEAFFVRTNKDANNNYIKSKSLTVKFNTTMMDVSAGNYPNDINQNQASLRVVADYAGVRSQIFVDVDDSFSKGYDSSEDIPFLKLDPNLCPVGLYSVADDIAVMRSGVDGLSIMPLFLNIADSADVVDHFSLFFSGVASLGDNLYLYDSMNDKYTHIFEGDSIVLESVPSDYARYYLTNTDAPTGLTDSSSSSVQVLSHREGSALVISSSDILSVRVYDLSGHLLFVDSDICSVDYTVSLSSGLYLFEVVTANETAVSKVFVK